MTCSCRKASPVWRVDYEGLVYNVCDECLDGRLDAADEFPTFEPASITRLTVSEIDRLTSKG